MDMNSAKGALVRLSPDYSIALGVIDFAIALIEERDIGYSNADYARGMAAGLAMARATIEEERKQVERVKIAEKERQKHE